MTNQLGNLPKTTRLSVGLSMAICTDLRFSRGNTGRSSCTRSSSSAPARSAPPSPTCSTRPAITRSPSRTAPPRRSKRSPRHGVKTVQLDFADAVALQAALKGHYAVLSAAPYHLTGHVAKAARLTGVQLFRPDRGRRHHPHGEGAGRRRRRRRSFPQCGLAPGFISIVAHDIASRFDKLDTVRLRVGALPQYPSNALSYNLTWSTDGVINEYIERCEAVVDGTLREVPAMEELRGILPRRHPLRGLQHLRRPRHAVRDASKARCAT